jgi:imidazolonepropionase
MNFLKLRSAAEGFLKRMSTMGVTTVEGKSGYGLDRETELLQLKVMRSLNNTEHKRVNCSAPIPRQSQMKSFRTHTMI